MVYLTWAAGDALRGGHLLLEDRHQFANRIERFTPMVLDPLVYAGGALSLVMPLALAYNLAQVVFPLLLFAIACYALLRTLEMDRAVAFGVALLGPFIPYRLLNSAMGQHNAASVCLLPIFYLCVTRALVLTTHPRRWFALAGLVLLLIGCSEEHLAVATVLFGWPFLVAHLLLFIGRAAPTATSRLPLVWLAILAKQAWPIAPSVVLLAVVALVERNQLLHHSIVSHVYGYDVVRAYSVEFNESYFQRTVGYHCVLLPVAIIGAVVVVAQLRRRRPDDASTRVVRFAFALIFVASTLLCLGYAATLTRLLHFDPYRFLFDHLPLLNMQRYPHRLCYAAYTSGFVMLACALDAGIRRLAARPRAALAARALIVLSLTAGALDWATRAPTTAFYDIAHDRQPALHRIIRQTGGRAHIVLALPAHNGSMWCDSRVLLTAIFTGARFFNGYWSHVPTIYWNLVGSIQRLGDNGQLSPDLLSELRRAGVEFLLVDKTAIRGAAFAVLRAHPALHIVYEDVAAAYFALNPRSGRRTLTSALRRR